MAGKSRSFVLACGLLKQLGRKAGAIMKAISKALVVAVMVLGATAATGCNRADKDGEAVAPVETPATAPVVEESAAKDDAATKAADDKPGFEQNAVRFGARFGTPRPYGPHYGQRYYAPHAPPMARVEYRGVAPSARHFWAPGYWRWSGREYAWVGGRWEYNRPGYVYVQPTWHRHHAARYEYVPGHWVRRY
jgi:hypothetical protein